MTPQLQQAIKLLQMSSIDLQQTIQATLDVNPLLELCEPETLTDNDDFTESNFSTEDKREQDTVFSDEGSWESLLYPDHYLRHRAQKNTDKSGFDIENQKEKEASLKDHLLWQMELTAFTQRDRVIANFIIDAINDDGYLSISLEELTQTINQQALTELEEPIEVKELEIVLHQIQQFDPVGIGARDLKECLLLQLAQFSHNMPNISEMRYMIENYLALMAKKQYSQLKNKMKLSDERLRTLLKQLKKLNPKPGLSILAKKFEYIIPDVIVRKHHDTWFVDLNTEFSPHLRINPSYAALIKRADSSRDNVFLKEQLIEARWFLKSLQNRNETLLKVASCIVKKQKDFLEKGPEAMKPLVLRDVASELQLHESTISRITTKKYLLTPRGTFELKHFFSSHLHKTGGEECSSTAIRAFIKKMIANEPATKPLSDHAIAKLLATEGIPIARRTVAKYRETLSIPPSHERKCLSAEE
ncbi:MAG: hypothetical protein RLZ35_618 [Pseudomonadota bacterium]